MAALRVAFVLYERFRLVEQHAVCQINGRDYPWISVGAQP